MKHIKLFATLFLSHLVAYPIHSLAAEADTQTATTTQANSVIVHGIGAEYGDKSYSGVGLKARTQNGLLDLEYGADYKKAAIVGKVNLGDTTNYIKGGLGYLDRDVKVVSQTKSVGQFSYGLAFGHTYTLNTNIEAGILRSQIGKVNYNNSFIDPGNVTTFYVEGIHRIITGYGQFDLAVTGKQSRLKGKHYTGADARASYYPTNNIGITLGCDTTDDRKSHDYMVSAGLQYRWGGTQAQSGWTPYGALNYNSTSGCYTALEYRTGIANTPLSMKDTFERDITSNTFKAQTLDPNKFVTKIEAPRVEEGSTNTAPTWTQTSYNTGITISDSSNASQVIFNLAAVSSDQESDNITYTIVSINSPLNFDDSIWSNSLSISDGKLIAQNLNTNDPAFSGTITVTIAASDGNETTNADVLFNYIDRQ